MADKVSLTPEEQRWLKPLFSEYDLDDSSIVMGERLRPLLEKSGLPSHQLSQIWQLVDTENRGFLDFGGFAKCMRLVQHSQQGLALSPRLANIPSAMPNFGQTQPTQTALTHSNIQSQPNVQSQSSEQVGSGSQPILSPKSPPLNPQSPFSTGVQPLTAFGTGGSTTSANGETRIPPLTTVDKKRFGTLFDRFNESSADGLMDGTQAREIFMKAKLPEDTLGKVWYLVDIEGRGRLTKNEFVVAMHLIQSLINRSMPNLPSALSASWLPWLGSGSSHVRQGSSISVPSDQVNGQNAKPIPPSTNRSSTDWTKNERSGSEKHVASVVIGQKERAQYDAIFDSLDTQRTGIVGPKETVPLLTKSGLPEDVLAKVWDLCDTRSRGQLDKGDFALAMHFVKAKLNGLELPDQVGPGAGASNSQEQATAADYSLSQSQLSPQGTPSYGANASLSAPSAKSVSSPSDFNDLVSLDNAVFKPLEPSKPKRVGSETDESKFVPTTLFGQQLLQQRQQNAQASVQTPQLSSQSIPAQQSTAEISDRAISQPEFPQATGIKQQQRDINELESKVIATKAENARANEELATILNQKTELERKLRELKVTYDNGTRKVHDTQQQIKSAQSDIKQLERDIALRTSGLDAIKNQHAQEQKTLDSLVSQRGELESQHASYQSEIERLTLEVDDLRKNHQTHQATIDQHQSKFSSLQQELEQLRWHRNELQRGAHLHQQNALHAQEQIEDLQQQIHHERGSQSTLTAKGVADSSASPLSATEPNAGERQIVANIPAPHNNLTSLLPSTPGAGPVAVLVESPLNRSSSIGSVPDSVTGSVPVADTPHTSPPTSEANYAAIDANMPTFTLPMERIHSATSSVVNNPPQSIRGDLGSEPSERPSPEFPPTPTGTYPQELSLNHRNSFDFVDASDKPAHQPHGSVAADTNGEEGQNSAPYKYGRSTSETPSMPGAFPTSEDNGADQRGLLQEKNSETRQIDDATSSTAKPSFAESKSRPLTVTAHSTNGLPATSLAAAEANHEATHNASREPASNLQKDEFDEFEGLEEAREDETDDINTPYTSDHVQNAGPDEWQQLFASKNITHTSQNHELSSSQPLKTTSASEDSQEVAELTSMGFSESAARSALKMHHYNLSEATNFLLDNMR